MADEEPSRMRRRGRATRARLRRHQEIDHVVVEESFVLNEPDDASSHATETTASAAPTYESKPATETSTKKKRAIAGEGCYVSATINNRRYYGVLVDQAALKAASLLHFQHEASGMELNRKMQALRLRQQHDNDGAMQDSTQNNQEKTNGIAESSENAVDTRKRSAQEEDSLQEAYPAKRPKPASITSGEDEHFAGPPRPVQKFRYVESSQAQQVGSQEIQRSSRAATLRRLPGYRDLLATFANVQAAAEDGPNLAKSIYKACESGGNFVGEYFYQYEVPCPSLDISDFTRSDYHSGLRMSMGFESFLQQTNLPSWFPLSNLQVDQQKVLNLLSMKKDSNGNAVWDDKAIAPIEIPSGVRPSLIPMEPRSRYRVCVVGGGIAGLSCCLEIFRECEKLDIDVEVVLLEGRSRLGGRLWTDRETFKTNEGNNFRVDLGASWIHGIQSNPLAALAREAGVDFITTSEEVKIFQAGMIELDKAKDERAGELFDKLLDIAADACWDSEESNGENRMTANQKAIRWYASKLVESTGMSGTPLPTAPPSHRSSSDMSVDNAIGNAITQKKFSEFAALSNEERRMLFWNLKNVEYALGANVRDLSIRFWDIDERHAFEGDHVILRQGYSEVVDHMLTALNERAPRFRCIPNFPVGKIEYARKTTSEPFYSQSASRHQQFVELSDTCQVTSESGEQSFKCDFAVCAVPLGVLKHSLSSHDDASTKLNFDPPLPFTKRDAIESVGFGLLNKVYIQFPTPFWRRPEVLEGKNMLFGNASGLNPHHYMFLDVGKTLSKEGENAPAILMSLISGFEAVKCECLSESGVVAETMTTLRTIFSKIEVPDPISFKVTRWGSDRFSRGSYTFLPPGTSDQDFQLLQSPVNANGDSILLEGSETMRLFFAGEHTTALHPSMAHGAMLSGARAAKEVVTAMACSFHGNDKIDKLIPITTFRLMNPKADLRCCMCHRRGNTVQEGSLLAFKKGSRQILVHNNCAENSPEVEVFEGQWKHIFKAVSRSKTLECSLCGSTGASIGCSDDNCYRSFHFACAEDTGWRFDVDGKEHYCDIHRTGVMNQDDCTLISVKYYFSKLQPRQQGSAEELGKCSFCRDARPEAGKLLAFQQKSRMALVHVNCTKYTTIVNTAPDPESRFDHEYRNVFTAIDRARPCEACGKPGATIECDNSSCSSPLHYVCALKTGWNFDEEPRFCCLAHRAASESYTDPDVEDLPPARLPMSDGLNDTKEGENQTESAKQTSESETTAPAFFSHALFASAGDIASVGETTVSSNAGKDQLVLSKEEEGPDASAKGSPDEEQKKVGLVQQVVAKPPCLGSKLTSKFDKGLRLKGARDYTMVRMHRPSLRDKWNLQLHVTPIPDKPEAFLSVASTQGSSMDPFDQLYSGDIITSINGMTIGSEELDTFDKVLSRLRQEVEIMIQVLRKISAF